MALLRFLLASAWVASGCVAYAQNLPGDLLEAKLRDKLKSLDQKVDGAFGVAVIDLISGKTITLNGDTQFPTASVIKVPILVEMFRQARAGEVNLREKISIQPSESVGGSGKIQDELRKGPVTMTILDLLTAMIEHSDNTATNRAIQIAKMDRVNRRTQELGLQATRLRRIMLDGDAASKGMENISTPLEMVRLMEMIYRGKACTHPDDCGEMMRILKLVQGKIRGAIPLSVEVASKTGELHGVHCEVAIVLHPKRPFAVGIFTSFLPDGENPLGEAARVIYEHFERTASANVYGNRGVK
jgi:beta-lactamase class A